VHSGRLRFRQTYARLVVWELSKACALGDGSESLDCWVGFPSRRDAENKFDFGIIPMARQFHLQLEFDVSIEKAKVIVVPIDILSASRALYLWESQVPFLHHLNRSWDI
jgi:hypothetical protein